MLCQSCETHHAEFRVSTDASGKGYSGYVKLVCAECVVRYKRNQYVSINEESAFDLVESFNRLSPDGDDSVVIEVPQRCIVDVQSFSTKLFESFLKYPSELKSINRRFFEELVAELWHGFGYEVELTKQTRDGGKDIVAVKNITHLEKLLIECKRPDEGNPLRVAAVRELYGVKVHEQATKGIIVTTTSFTPDAKDFLMRHEWELEGKDFEGLIGWIERYVAFKRNSS